MTVDEQRWQAAMHDPRFLLEIKRRVIARQQAEAVRKRAMRATWTAMRTEAGKASDTILRCLGAGFLGLVIADQICRRLGW